MALSSVAIFVFTLVVARLQREAQKAAIEAKHLGQYRLEEQLGAGAMGVVYKGHHAMLRRPTAIKMLNVDKVNEASIERFEREVQITCKLNNPNTVAIYDYGRTPEGVFYYAMEYLDGIDLQVLVEQYGPQPEGRVIRILKQMCGSLYEAHSLGLVHRDIKPANVMLNRRGGEPDVVKVLDFGLVQALDDAKQSRQSGGLTGTPLYMSPEAIQTPDLVDARSDLYAVGAVGYFLITGQPVFTATSLVDLCQQHVDRAARRAVAAARQAGLARVGSRLARLPGEDAGQTTADGPRPRQPARPRRHCRLLDAERRRSLVGPPRTGAGHRFRGRFRRSRTAVQWVRSRERAGGESHLQQRLRSNDGQRRWLDLSDQASLDGSSRSDGRHNIARWRTRDVPMHDEANQWRVDVPAWMQRSGDKHPGWLVHAAISGTNHRAGIARAGLRPTWLPVVAAMLAPCGCG